MFLTAKKAGKLSKKNYIKNMGVEMKNIFDLINKSIEEGLTYTRICGKILEGNQKDFLVGLGYYVCEDDDDGNIVTLINW